jgi:predicted RNA-binding Zn ribbon-like protein
VPHGADFVWDQGHADALDLIVRRVLWATAQLVTSPALARLRQCANRECGWLFLDTTKNNSRRWCSMEECGSRDKARRYYRRSRRRAASGRRRR